MFLGDNPFQYAVPRLLAQISLSSALTLYLSNLLKPYGQPTMVSQALVINHIPLLFS